MYLPTKIRLFQAHVIYKELYCDLSKQKIKTEIMLILRYRWSSKKTDHEEKSKYFQI